MKKLLALVAVGFLAANSAYAPPPVSDTDFDGVSDLVENAAPNAGDGNFDSTLDYLQENVASLEAAAGGGYLTVAVTTLPVAGSVPLHNVQSLTEAAVGVEDPVHDYPFGLLSFKVGSAVPAEHVEVKVFYHGAPSSFGGWPYRKYGPLTPGVASTAAWYTLPGSTWAIQNGVPVVRFELWDNVLGDDTGDDNEIYDQGGAAKPQPVPIMGQPGRLAMIGMICLLGLIAVTRRLLG